MEDPSHRVGACESCRLEIVHRLAIRSVNVDPRDNTDLVHGDMIEVVGSPIDVHAEAAPGLRSGVSAARQARGSCRGPGPARSRSRQVAAGAEDVELTEGRGFVAAVANLICTQTSTRCSQMSGPRVIGSAPSAGAPT